MYVYYENIFVKQSYLHRLIYFLQIINKEDK